MRVRDARLRWLGLAAASLIAVGACSSGPGASSPPAASNPAPSTAASADAGSSAPSAAPDAKAARDAVCEAAKAEGKLTYWSNFAHGEPIIQAFQTAYPGITVEPLSNHPDDFVQALITELTAGRAPSADILYGELNVLLPLQDMKAIDDTIDWKALGVADDLIPDSMNVVRLYRVAGGLVYNTSTYKPEDLPNTWDELLDAKWDHQVVVDPRGRPFDQLSLEWGHDKTIDYVKKLNDFHPVVIKGGTAGMLAVAGGQAAFTTGGRSAETLEQKAAGAPLEIKYLDTITTLDTYNVVPKGVAHPNAAKCMVAWLATDGQKIHDEAEFKSNETVPTGAPADAKYAEVKSAADADTVGKIGEEIGQIFGGTGG
jgi:iron(III) transport system substrate-binding protein